MPDFSFRFFCPCGQKYEISDGALVSVPGNVEVCSLADACEVFSFSCCSCGLGMSFAYETLAGGDKGRVIVRFSPFFQYL